MRELFKEIGTEIACIIVEPVAGNMNCVPATQSFHDCMRALCTEYGSLLIFDEVMTGFRVALGGAQSIYKIKPDITILGKVIGGGMPVGAFGGRADIMNHLAPDGPVYQAGTLSGNPVAMAAGMATLNAIAQPGFFEALEQSTRRLLDGLRNVARETSIPFTTTQSGGMFGLFFTEEETISRFDQVMACNVPRFKHFFHGMLDQGIYLAPSAYEAGFVSSAHTNEHIQTTINAASVVMKTL